MAAEEKKTSISWNDLDNILCRTTEISLEFSALEIVLESMERVAASAAKTKRGDEFCSESISRFTDVYWNQLGRIREMLDALNEDCENKMDSLKESKLDRSVTVMG